MEAQDQAISTNYFKNKILKEETESKCRLCKQHEESTDHLTSGCSILVKNEYLIRHDKVCTHLHYSICKTLDIETNIIIIIIIIIMPVIIFMQAIYNYIPETNHVSTVYTVAAVLYLQDHHQGVNTSLAKVTIKISH